MHRKLLVALGLITAAALSVAFSPKPLRADIDPGVKCYCSGGCENYANYNYCSNGMCSWFCNVAES